MPRAKCGGSKRLDPKVPETKLKVSPANACGSVKFYEGEQRQAYLMGGRVRSAHLFCCPTLKDGFPPLHLALSS